jgi:hypothetical protein
MYSLSRKSLRDVCRCDIILMDTRDMDAMNSTREIRRIETIRRHIQGVRWSVCTDYEMTPEQAAAERRAAALAARAAIETLSSPKEARK